MTTARESVSRTILKEIDALSDPVVKDVARDILEFEIQNWKMERVHYKDYFENLISTQAKRRSARP